MLEVLRFIFSSIIEFMTMLFSINVDSGLSLGLLFCICFILLPIVLRISRFIKQDALEELDDKYDESRPRETWSFSENQHYNPTTGKASRSYSSKHVNSRSRRYRLR